MKKLKFFAAVVFATTFTIAFSQPTHPVVSTYTYANPSGYSKTVLPNNASHNQTNNQDIAVSGNFHYQCGTTTFSINGVVSTRMFLCKKNANTGAPLGMSNFNFGEIFGEPLTVDICKGMLLDESNNRIYLFGTSQVTGSYSQAVVICYNLATLGLETNFAGWGATPLSGINRASDIVDMAMIGELNGGKMGVFVALVNQKDENGVDYISMPMMDRDGGYVCEGMIKNTAYGCFGKRIKTYDGVFYVVGSAVSTGKRIPMIWKSWLDETNCTVVVNQTAADFINPPLGFGEFIDFAYSMDSFRDIIAIGNTTAKNGIWAKYRNTGAPIFVLSTTFKGTKVGNTFARALLQPDGYTVVLTSNASPALGKLGYIDQTGTSYKDTRNLLTKESTALNNDEAGNIIIGGCYANVYTTAKFASYNGTWWGSANRVEGAMAVSKLTNETDGLIINTFPNPFTNMLTLVFNESYSDVNTSIQVMDISGKKVMEQKGIRINGNNERKLDFSNLKNGTYFIRVVSDDKSIIKKVLKK
ncbi:MAG: T9SS type A sorting domain-containing protein [Bacteroidia bacterium]